MLHLDLFSGIGGFALAARWAGFKTRAFCEIDPFCRAVLKKHWSNIPIYKDIATVNATRLRADGIGEIDLITGGFPCQPFSCAGQRKGAADDRHIWPEMLRLIAQTRPAWVVCENVPGIIGMELDRCLADLEAENFAWQTFIIPACAVDAPHRRDRVWIVANDQGDGRGPRRAGRSDTSGTGEREQTFSAVADAEKPQGIKSAAQAHSGATPGPGGARFIRGGVAVPGQGGENPAAWVAEPGICRVAHGIPDGVDRVKALGNAIVPQVAYKLLSCLE